MHDRLLIFDRLDVVDLLGIPVRHHDPGPPLDEERPRSAAADRRRPGRLVRLDEHSLRP